MPLFDNNLLDDQPTFDATPDFRGGMNTTLQPHLLDVTQYARALNMQLTKTGRLQTRGGTAVKGDFATEHDARAICYFQTPSIEEVVVVGDNEMQVWDNSTFSAVSGYDLTGDVSAFQGDSKTYVCGAAKLMEYDGTDVYKVTRLTVTVDTPGTGYAVGDALTFTGGSPVENAEGEVASIGTSGEITGITITNRGRGFTSAPTVGVTSAGSGAVLTAALVDPPTGTLACWHTKRIFLAGDTVNPTTLRVSDILDGAYWSTTNSIDIGADGEPITGLFSWDNYNLLVLKENSTYLIATDPAVSPANWQIQKVSSSVGCVAHKTLVQVGADVWWLSRQGVVSVRRMVQETQREISIAISTPIQSYVDRITWANVHKSCATFFDNKFILSIPIDGSAEPNRILVSDTFHQVWVSEWDFGANDMVSTRFSGEAEFYFANDVGELRKYTPDVEQDVDGATDTEITTELDLRAFQFNERVSPKSLLNIELEFQGSNATLDVSLSVDEHSDETLVTGMATALTLLTLPFTLPAVLSDGGHYRKAFGLLQYRRVRQVQPKLSSTSGTLSLRSVLLSAFIETIQIQH